MSNVPEEARCTEPAIIRRFWPGREPDFVCLGHAEDTRKIGSIVGPIHMEPILLPEEPIPCACTKGHVQEIKVD